MFVAGTDTSAATLEWTMTELAEHPVLMKQAREEVRAVGRPTGEVVDETHLQHLQFIKAAIEEAMRLIHCIGRDPNSWDSPLQFNPNRFQDSTLISRIKIFAFYHLEVGHEVPSVLPPSRLHLLASCFTLTGICLTDFTLVMSTLMRFSA
ncbi:hypothetical protein Gotur_002752 [Gossypium turneri]